MWYSATVTKEDTNKYRVVGGPRALRFGVRENDAQVAGHSKSPTLHRIIHTCLKEKTKKNSGRKVILTSARDEDRTALSVWKGGLPRRLPASFQCPTLEARARRVCGPKRVFRSLLPSRGREKKERREEKIKRRKKNENRGKAGRKQKEQG